MCGQTEIDFLRLENVFESHWKFIGQKFFLAWNAMFDKIHLKKNNLVLGIIIAWVDRIWTIVVYQLLYLIDFLDFIDRLAVWTPLWALLGEQRVSRPTSKQPICNQQQETIFQHKNQFTETRRATQIRKHQNQLQQSNRL